MKFASGEGVLPRYYRNRAPAVAAFLSAQGITGVHYDTGIESAAELFAMAQGNHMIITVLIGEESAHTMYVAGANNGRIALMNPAGLFGLMGTVGSADANEVWQIFHHQQQFSPPIVAPRK